MEQNIFIQFLWIVILFIASEGGGEYFSYHGEGFGKIIENTALL